MLISKSKKFIFLHIPKTAGSSMRDALGDYADFDTTFAHAPVEVGLAYYQQSKDTLKHVARMNFDLLGTYPPELGAGNHITQEYLKNSGLWLEDLTGYFEFTIVRNPLDRVVSMYNHRNKDKSCGPNFLRFAKRVKMNYQGNFDLNNFYRPQTAWITHPLTDKVHIFKFEDLAESVEPLEMALGFKLDFPHVNRNRMKTISSVADLSDEEVEYCLDFLEQEYNDLGYDITKDRRNA